MELQQTYHLHCRQDRNMPPAPAHRENMPDLPQAYRTTTNGDPFLVDEEMKREFLFLHHRTHCSFWQIHSIGMLMVHSVSVRKFSSNCMRYMVGMTEQFFLVCSYFCQIKTKTLTINYLNSYSNSCAINALQNRNIEVQGCFYHLSANIWKHTQHLGLSQRYDQEQEFALHIRMLPALAFLPAGNVIDGLEELVDTIRLLYDDMADDLLQYFEDTYIGRYCRNHQDDLYFLLLTFETRSTELTMNYHAPTIS